MTVPNCVDTICIIPPKIPYFTSIIHGITNIVGSDIPRTIYLCSRSKRRDSYSQLPGSLSPDYKHLHARQIAR